MKTYLVIAKDQSRIYGAGATKAEAEADARLWVDNFDQWANDFCTIYAEVDASRLDEIDADTPFTEKRTKP